MTQSSYVLQKLVEEARVRKLCIEGVDYFSVIDLFTVWLNTDRKKAQNYYHVLKKRLKDNNAVLPVTIKIKAQTTDEKFYLTDFVDSTGIEIFYGHVSVNVKKRSTRIQHRKADEIANFHPLVIKVLTHQNWRCIQHVRLNSGRIIDLVAVSNSLTYVIECKPRLAGGNFYSAVGQVLCYCQEYDTKAIPVIASYGLEINDYIKHSCDALGIELIRI